MITIVAKNFIGGAWRKGDPNLQTLNPANLNEIAGQAQGATEEDLNDAVATALQAIDKWQSFGSAKRSDFVDNFVQTLRRYAQEIAKYLTHECGFPLKEAQEEVQEAIRASQCIAGLVQFRRGVAMSSCRPGVDITTWRKPLGVIACIGSWRRPLSGPVCQILPCLIAGNTVVFKSSEKSLATSQWLSRVFLESGLGEGMVNVLYGDGQSVGADLVRHKDISAVLIDGKCDTIQSVKEIAVAKRGMSVLSPVTGESVVMVLDDADLNIAIETAITSVFRASGQLRSSAKRILVAESIVDAFCDRFYSAVLKLSVGDGMNPETIVGPLINRNAVDRYLEKCQGNSAEGNEVLIRGDRLASPTYDTGCFVSPTVIRIGPMNGDVPCESEPIGPMACIDSFSSIEHAVLKVNAIPNVQALSIITEGTTSWRYVRDRANYTAGYVNHPTTLSACWDIELALDTATSHAVFVLGARCKD